ncbi:MAG: NUDIX domain-containing protein [Prevotella sp.]|nr:NUDIX domain-containing protein [Prevotella sp.]
MQEEIFPIVNEEGIIIGNAPRSVCHNGSKLLHPVIHLHLFNSKGELFLQKRSYTKDIQPGKWDTAVAGHIDLDETPLEAVNREALEELGISGFNIHFILKYIIETDREKELSYCYHAIYNGTFILNKEELDDGRFWTIEEIHSNLDKNIFTLNFESDFNKFLFNRIDVIM